MSKFVAVVWIRKYISFFGKILSPIIPFILPAIFLLLSNFFSEFKIWKLVVALILFIITGVLLIKIKDFYDENESRFSSLIGVLEKDFQKKAEEMNKRPARMSPDETLTDFSLYQNLITDIKTKGFIDFYCQNMECEIFHGEPLVLSAIEPGMHQFFIVLNYPDKPKYKGYFRVYNEIMVKKGFNKRLQIISTYRDFTYTIYYDLLPILGNLSKSISEKQIGAMYEESFDEHYKIFHYKFKKIKEMEKERFFRLRVFI